jgi:hypothetical protein
MGCRVRIGPVTDHIVLSEVSGDIFSVIVVTNCSLRSQLGGSEHTTWKRLHRLAVATSKMELLLDSNSQGVVSRLGDTTPSLLHQLHHYIASEEEHPYDALQ